MNDTKSQYFIQIDTLRCLAIVLVLLTHWTSYHWVLKTRIGYFGLDLFFVISGFLITRILLLHKTKVSEGQKSKKQYFKTFYVRRFLRIFPLYYFVLFITYLFNTGIVRESFSWNFFYLSNFFMMRRGDWAGIVSHFWSLSVEEQFYLVWPLFVLLIANKHFLKISIAIVVLAVAWRWALFEQKANAVTLHVFTPLCFDAFGLGGMLAYLHLYKEALLQKILGQKWLFPILVAMLGFISISEYLYEFYNIYEMVFHRLVGSMVAFWLVGKACYGFQGFAKVFFENRYLIYIGQISYSIYLFHNFIPGFLLPLRDIFPRPVLFVIFLITAIIIGFLTQKLIEQPFLKLKKHFKY